MATAAAVLIPSQRQRVRGYSWNITDDDPVGEAVEIAAWQDRTVQIEGTFASATVVIQGSNDGTNWQTLRDPGSTALSTTSALLKSILELPRYIRPSSSGGGGTQDIDVTLYARGDTI